MRFSNNALNKQFLVVSSRRNFKLKVTLLDCRDLAAMEEFVG